MNVILMNRAAFERALANSTVGPRGPLAEDQRRAMFARIRGGGGGSRGTAASRRPSSGAQTAPRGPAPGSPEWWRQHPEVPGNPDWYVPGGGGGPGLIGRPTGVSQKPIPIPKFSASPGSSIPAPSSSRSMGPATMADLLWAAFNDTLSGGHGHMGGANNPGAGFIGGSPESAGARSNSAQMPATSITDRDRITTEHEANVAGATRRYSQKILQQVSAYLDSQAGRNQMQVGERNELNNIRNLMQKTGESAMADPVVRTALTRYARGHALDLHGEHTPNRDHSIRLMQEIQKAYGEIDAPNPAFPRAGPFISRSRLVLG